MKVIQDYSRQLRYLLAITCLCVGLTLILLANTTVISPRGSAQQTDLEKNIQLLELDYLEIVKLENTDGRSTSRYISTGVHVNTPAHTAKVAASTPKPIIMSSIITTTTPTPVVVTAPSHEPVPPGQYYDRRTHKVYNSRRTYSVTGEGICSSNTHVVVLIQASPDHVDVRQAIRDTWGAFSRTQQWPRKGTLAQQVKLGFMFGQSLLGTYDNIIRQEDQTYGDVIQADFIDSYTNLTYKTLASLDWVRTYCPSASYFVKCDDDTILNIPNLLSFLEVNTIHYGIAGALGMKLRTMRTGKWAVTEEQFPFDTFPPYFSGPAYVMHAECIQTLLDEAEWHPLVPIEDAHVTGILAQIVNIRRFSPGGFTTTISYPPSLCDFTDVRFIAGTNLDLEPLKDIWNSYVTGIGCPEWDSALT